MRALTGVVIVVVGIAALVVGVLYLTQEAHALPTFFPGYLAGSTAKHTARGIAGIVVGAVLVVAGVVVAAGGRRTSW